MRQQNHDPVVDHLRFLNFLTTMFLGTGWMLTSYGKFIEINLDSFFPHI